MGCFPMMGVDFFYRHELVTTVNTNKADKNSCEGKLKAGGPRKNLLTNFTRGNAIANHELASFALKLISGSNDRATAICKNFSQPFPSLLIMTWQKFFYIIGNPFAKRKPPASLRSSLKNKQLK